MASLRSFHRDIGAGFSGVLDRFPTLKFGFFEVGIGWIPWLLDRLEMAVRCGNCGTGKGETAS